MPDLNKFFQDPDFHFVFEMLSQNAERMEDITTIDLTQSAETIKAIIAGRQETLKLINNFKEDVETYKKKSIKNDNQPSFQ